MPESVAGLRRRERRRLGFFHSRAPSILNLNKVVKLPVSIFSLLGPAIIRGKVPRKLDARESSNASDAVRSERAGYRLPT